MPGVQRQGDPNTAGGVATSGVGSVRINGRPVVVNGTPVSAHAPCPKPGIHCSASTTGGLGSVRAAGIPVNVNGNPDTCGHTRSAGSPNVRAGG